MKSKEWRQIADQASKRGLEPLEVLVKLRHLEPGVIMKDVDYWLEQEA